MILPRLTGIVALPETIPSGGAPSPIVSRYTFGSHAGDSGGHGRGQRVLDGSGLDRDPARGPVPPRAVPRLSLVRVVPPRDPDGGSAPAPGAEAPRPGGFGVRSSRRERLLLANFLAHLPASDQLRPVRSGAGVGLSAVPVRPARPRRGRRRAV